MKCLEQSSIRPNSAQENDRYITIMRFGFANNLLIVIAKETLKERLSNIENSAVPFGNYLSSKCAVLIRMVIDDTPIVFIGCQLDYGR